MRDVAKFWAAISFSAVSYVTSSARAQAVTEVNSPTEQLQVIRVDVTQPLTLEMVLAGASNVAASQHPGARAADVNDAIMSARYDAAMDFASAAAGLLNRTLRDDAIRDTERVAAIAALARPNTRMESTDLERITLFLHTERGIQERLSANPGSAESGLNALLRRPAATVFALPDVLDPMNTEWSLDESIARSNARNAATFNVSEFLRVARELVVIERTWQRIETVDWPLAQRLMRHANDEYAAGRLPLGEWIAIRTAVTEAGLERSQVFHDIIYDQATMESALRTPMPRVALVPAANASTPAPTPRRP